MDLHLMTPMKLYQMHPFSDYFNNSCSHPPICQTHPWDSVTVQQKCLKMTFILFIVSDQE